MRGFGHALGDHLVGVIEVTIKEIDLVDGFRLMSGRLGLGYSLGLVVKTGRGPGGRIDARSQHRVGIVEVAIEHLVGKLGKLFINRVDCGPGFRCCLYRCSGIFEHRIDLNVE